MSGAVTHLAIARSLRVRSALSFLILIMKKKSIKYFITYLGEKNITSFAASAAFFMVLSIFPLLILICSLLPYTGLTIDGLFEYMSEIVPPYIIELCRSMFIEFDQSKIAIISVTALLAVWASGKGSYALKTGILAIYETEEKDNFAIARIKSSLYTVFFIVVVFFYIVVMVLGNKIMDFLTVHLPNLNYVLQLLVRVRFLFIWILMTLIFQIMYILMPGKKSKFYKLFPGALFASVGWNILSFGFSLYINVFGNISIYGNFVGVIFALLWLYWSMYILLMGATINYFNDDDSEKING